MSHVDAQPLWDWMEERHAIYVRKAIREGVDPAAIYAAPGADLEEADPEHFAARPSGPLTLDPVLGEFRFCNVFRELDRVTVWVRENVREPFADHPNLWLMLAIARTINWPDTLAFLFERGAMPNNLDWTPDLLTAGLQDYAATGAKVYTGAYMIRAESDPNKEWFSWTKHRYIAEIVIGRLWEDRANWEEFLTTDDPNNQLLRLQDVWELFQTPRYIGWGPFMAYEVVTDLRHTRYLRNAPDIYTWANAGPGAIRGLNRLHGRPLKGSIPRAQSNAEMKALLDDAPARLPAWFPAGDLEMRDIEHSLCEVDKWLRVKEGDGKPRAKYVPGRGY